METQSRVSANGTGTHSEQWRDEAMNASLRGFDNDEGLNALLAAIRQNRPGVSTLTAWPDRFQLMQFLQTKTAALRSLLSGSSKYFFEQRGQTWPYLGWYEVTWKGHDLEVALTPGYGHYDDVVCLGDDETLLHRFVKALTDYAARPEGRCLRYSNGWESATEMDAEIGRVTWDDIVLPPDTLARLREAVEGYFHHRESFAALGFPWRRGVLLVGPPGTGKTMICKAAAAALPNLPFLYVRDLRDHDRKEAIKAIFERARQLAPCLLVFEDMDGLVTEDNRTVFLNEMDGVQNNEGLFVIASSNHPGKIDEALLKRPSRFDRVFHIGLPGTDERQEFCRRLLSRTQLADRLAPSLDIEALVRDVADRSSGFTPAYLKEVFVSAALQRAQDGAMILDDQFARAALAQVEELRAHLKRMKDPDALAEMNTGLDAIGLRH